MNVVSGLSWETREGKWRKISVSLDEVDLQRMQNEGLVPTDISTGQIYKTLTREADKLIILKMHSEGVLTAEETKKRLAELW